MFFYDKEKQNNSGNASSGDGRKYSDRCRSCIVKGAAEPEPLKVPHHGVYNTALQELFETGAGALGRRTYGTVSF